MPAKEISKRLKPAKVESVQQRLKKKKEDISNPHKQKVSGTPTAWKYSGKSKLNEKLHSNWHQQDVLSTSGTLDPNT